MALKTAWSLAVAEARSPDSRVNDAPASPGPVPRAEATAVWCCPLSSRSRTLACAANHACASLAAAYFGARGDLLHAQARGSATVEAVAQVGIVAQEAHADESLTLIDNTGDDGYQGDYLALEKVLGPGPGTLLTAASTAATATPAGPAVEAAVTDARAWFAAQGFRCGREVT